MFKLVEDRYNWKKWWSMRFTIISAIFSSAAVAWMSLPFDWQAEMPSWVKIFLCTGALTSSVAAGVARVVKQKNVESPDDSDSAGA